MLGYVTVADISEQDVPYVWDGCSDNISVTSSSLCIYKLHILFVADTSPRRNKRGWWSMVFTIGAWSIPSVVTLLPIQPHLPPPCLISTFLTPVTAMDPHLLHHYRQSGHLTLELWWPIWNSESGVNWCIMLLPAAQTSIWLGRMFPVGREVDHPNNHKSI